MNQAVDSIMRDSEAPERQPASPDRPATRTAMLDGHSLARPTRPATLTLQGCAFEDCLEIAKPGSNHCPLHD